MKYSNHRVEDLVLYITNTGATYQDRLHIARIQARPSQYRYAAWRWIDTVAHASVKYEKEFGIDPNNKFTTEDLLETALHLAAYYREHLAEMKEPSN